MFQESALYPWLTLEANLALALELQKVAKADARLQARDWLAKLSLQGFEAYYPHQVSGGMRQREALASMTLQDSLRQLIRKERPTVLLVTHDVDEALFLADRILVFSPRPVKVLREFNLNHHKKTHDLSEFVAIRREILCLLGIRAEQDEFAKN